MSHYPVTQLNLCFCLIGDTGAEVLAKDYSNETVTAHLLKMLNLKTELSHCCWYESCYDDCDDK